VIARLVRRLRRFGFHGRAPRVSLLKMRAMVPALLIALLTFPALTAGPAAMEALPGSAAVQAGSAVQAPAPARAPQSDRVRVPDLDNQLVDPLQTAAGTRATVLVFLSVSCPISNRYAPDIQKLQTTFGAQGVRFWLVYPNPNESSADVRTHLKTYGYAMPALRDPKHTLADAAHVTITPEAAVYDQHGALVYHGRIDDRYTSIGVERPAPTRRDLSDAIAATLAGKPVTPATQQAVGCYIADFVE
jgi:hypothetical protein